VISYRVCGLRCLSNCPIPGFGLDSIQSGPIDTVFSVSPDAPAWVSEACALRSHGRGSNGQTRRVADSGCTVISRGSDDFFELVYGDGARFFVDGPGSKVWATAPPPLTIDDLGTYLRGSVLGFVLRRQGIPALHASAIEIRKQAVVFCGASEAGKSTLAAALSLRGLSVLSDDITALKEAYGRFEIQSGCPWICLWPDTVSNLLGKADALPQITPTWNKCYLALKSGAFELCSRPCAGVYVLGARDTGRSAPRLETIGARGAMLELLKHSYTDWALDRSRRASEFDTLSRLATQVPVKRIVSHTDGAKIDKLCDLILKDLELVPNLRNSAVSIC
jgi:hypothetical protein